MKKLFVFLMSLTALSTLCSCRQGYYNYYADASSEGYKNMLYFGNSNKRHIVYADDNYVTKSIPVKDFCGIDLFSGIDVCYTQSDKSGVEVYAPENIIDCLDIAVRGNRLSISFKEDIAVYFNDINIAVFSESLNDINVVGSGSFEFKNGLKSDNMNIRTVGSGLVTGNGIRCDNGLKVDLRGSGNVSLGDVNAERLDIESRGSGNLKINEVLVASTDMEIAGSGSVVVNRMQSADLKVELVGSGNLLVDGQAQNADFSVRGSGDIKAVDLEVQSVSCDIRGSGNIKCNAVKTLKSQVTGSGKVGYKGNPEVFDLNSKLFKL